MAMDLSMAIFDAQITVLDYETTGSLKDYPNEPWQIGLVSLINGKVDPSTKFECLLRVDASRPFNSYAPGRHAVLRSEIANAPTPQEVWPEIMPRLTGYPLCAHNVATEKKFTRLMAPLHQFGHWIDTLRIARKVWPGCSSYALKDIIEVLDLEDRLNQICPGREAHDALYDAIASALLLEYLLEQPGWGNATVGELAGM